MADFRLVPAQFSQLVSLVLSKSLRPIQGLGQGGGVRIVLLASQVGQARPRLLRLDHAPHMVEGKLIRLPCEATRSSCYESESESETSTHISHIVSSSRHCHVPCTVLQLHLVVVFM